ncbi:MAG: hypothetical protein CM1200mP41_15700 [Gammaproteobacteria bacterium]|nr:MAG: hypothetical protein CM1200mP41_15700 [Gammaproteobacteria bacterium]
MSADKGHELQVAAASVHTSVALVDYAQALLAALALRPGFCKGCHRARESRWLVLPGRGLSSMGRTMLFPGGPPASGGGCS